MKTLCLFIALGLSFALVGSSAAQQKPAKSSKPQPAAEAEGKDKDEGKEKKEAEAEMTVLQQRGLDLLRQAAEDAIGIEDRRSSAKILAAAADALWERDQERARKLFQHAFETAVNYYRDTKDDNLVRVTQGGSIGRQDLRLEVIKLASGRDAALGRKFSDQYIEEKKRELQENRTQNKLDGGGDSRLFGKTDPASGDLLRTAQTLLAVDLKLAVSLAQRAFSTGIPQSAPSFFIQLANRDRTSADQVYLTALERLRNDGAATPGQLLLLSAYPFGENRVWVTDGENTNSYGFQPPKDFTLDEQLIRRFIATAFTVLARTTELDPSQSPDVASWFGGALFAARLLEPKVAQYQPALLGDWRGLGARLAGLTAVKAGDGVEHTLQDVARETRQATNPDNTDRIKELLDRAQQTADFARRDDLYQQAAFETNRGGDLSRALNIADKISDSDFRSKVRSWLNFDAATRATNERRFDDARRLALEVEATDERAYLFFQIASAALKEKDRARAIELLNEAAQRATAADNSPEKIRAQLGIANIYAGIDPLRGFEIIGEAVKAANRIPNYSPDQTGLVRALSMRSGRGSMIMSNSVEGFDLGKTLAILARSDFDRALLLAQSLDSKPLKLATLVAIASAVFDKKQMAQAQ